METGIYEYFSVFIMALLVYSLTPFIIRRASALNFVDKSVARKIHFFENIPLLGGLEVATGFVLLCIYDVLISPGRYLDKPMLGYLAVLL